MPLAKSMMNAGKTLDIQFPDERDTLPAPPPDDYVDDEPTVKIQVPTFHPQVIVEEEKRYPGIGMLIAFGTGIAFWGTVAWLIFR
jgi:hypothetical protein